MRGETVKVQVLGTGIYKQFQNGERCPFTSTTTCFTCSIPTSSSSQGGRGVGSFRSTSIPETPLTRAEIVSFHLFTVN